MRTMAWVGLAGLFGAFIALQTQADIINLSDDMATKTGWIAVVGGDGGYVAAPDFVYSETSHSSVTTGASQRQKPLDTNVQVENLDSFTLSFRTMLHNSIAAVNEAVSRVGVITAGGTPQAGEVVNAWITLRRVGSIQLDVQAADGIGGTTTILSTSSPVDTVVGAGQGLSGYNYADWTVTRTLAGDWTVTAVNPYGDTVVNIAATESTVAASSDLNRVWIDDLAGQWNGVETAAYHSHVEVTSDPAGTAVTITNVMVEGTLGIQFESLPGTDYQLGWSTNLVDWDTKNLTIHGQGQTETAFDPSGFDTNKTYRIVTVP